MTTATYDPHEIADRLEAQARVLLATAEEFRAMQPQRRMVRVARALLDAHESRADIRDILMQRFEIRRSRAYEIIELALQERS